MSGDEFTDAQKRFLEGYASGIAISRAAKSMRIVGSAAPAGPEASHILAQDRVTGAGGKLADQEMWKRKEHPFDSYARLARQAATGATPNPEDNFRWRYHGLFYVAPAQPGFMARLRLANGIINHWQLAGLARLAAQFGGGYAHVTTRANLQVREIKPEAATPFLEGLQDLGIVARGSGADNIRNVTGSATAGVDPAELLDTRPLARAWHFHILNDRSLYGLPRKFNVAFDGGGAIATLEETNDIGFCAAKTTDGSRLPEGVWMKLLLGGITGHRTIAADTGLVCRPEECVEVADAIVRIFIEHGIRTDRTKARMKYVIDAWGLDKYLDAVEERLGRKLLRAEADDLSPRRPADRLAHVGVHPQKQHGKVYAGVSLPVGKISSEQMQVLAAIAARLGDGDIRLTVWQNLLLSGINETDVAAVDAELDSVGLSLKVSHVRAGLVACTGSKGCKFAASDTKGDALRIAEHVEARLNLDQPVNIHLTGCHHSCAQHFIGDIGLIGAKVPQGDDGETVDGYNIVVGGGFSDLGSIGKPLLELVPADQCPARVEAILRAYLVHRAAPDESFHSFAGRMSPEELRALLDHPAGLRAVA